VSSKCLQGAEAMEVVRRARELYEVSDNHPYCLKCRKLTGFTMETYKGKEKEWGFLIMTGQLDRIIIEDCIFLPRNICASCAGFEDGWRGIVDHMLPNYFPESMKKDYDSAVSFGVDKKKEQIRQEKRNKVETAAQDIIRKESFTREVKEAILGITTHGGD